MIQYRRLMLSALVLAASGGLLLAQGPEGMGEGPGPGRSLTRDGEDRGAVVRKIERDANRFKQIVRGKIKSDLRKYITHGEMIGRKGKDMVNGRDKADQPDALAVKEGKNIAMDVQKPKPPVKK